jgi:hypothetical protein
MRLRTGALRRLPIKLVTVQIRREGARRLEGIQRKGDRAMSNDGVLFSRPLQGYAHGFQAVYARKSMDFVQDSASPTSVAVNGSVGRNDAAMARAAENVARWKTYLSDECVRAMMNAGWHWST